MIIHFTLDLSQKVPYYYAMVKKDYSLVEFELRKLGLNENEAKTYMACLELGRTSVQNIARKVNLTRPTVYRILEKMEKRELVKKIKQRGNPFIIAQSPDELLGLLRSQKRKIEEQEREFIRIIALLKAKYQLPHKNEIKNYSGVEGKNFLLEDLSSTHASQVFTVFSSASDPLQKDLEKIYRSIQNRLKKIDICEIYPEKVKSSALKFVTRKSIEKNLVYFPGTLIVYDKIIYFQKNQAFVIENENFVYPIKSIINTLWKLG